MGVVIPIINGKLRSEEGMAFRTRFGELNSFVLDSLCGLDEAIQYGQGDERKNNLLDVLRILLISKNIKALEKVYSVLSQIWLSYLLHLEYFS